MSLNSLIDLATSRDGGHPVRRERFEPAGRSAGTATSNPSPVASFGGILVAAIPSEVLVLYTAWVTVGASRFTPTPQQAATLDTAQLTDLWQLRIAVAVAAVIGITVYVYQGWKAAGNSRRRAPVAELAAALIAFVAWALAMPDGLLGLRCSSADLSTTSSGVAAAAALLLAGLAGPLKREAKQTKTQRPGGDR